MIPDLKATLARFLRLTVKPAWSMLDQGSGALVGFLVSVYVGRLMGAEGLGLYAISYTIVIFLEVFQSACILRAFIVAGPRLFEKERGPYSTFVVLGNVLLSGMFTAVVTTGVVLAYLFEQVQVELLVILLSAALFSNVATLRTLVRVSCYVEHRPGLAFAQSIAFAALAFLGLAGLYVNDTVNIPAVYGVLAVSGLIVCVLQLLSWRSRFQLPDAAARRRYYAEHWFFARWNLMAVPFRTANQRGFPLLVGLVLDPLSAGLFRAANLLFVPFTHSLRAFDLLLTPQASKRFQRYGREQQIGWVLRVAAVTLGIALLYSATVAFFSEFLVRLLFGKDFELAPVLVWIMAIVPLFGSASFTPQIFLTVHKRLDLKLLAVVAAFVVGLGSSLVLMWAYGLVGAACGFAVTRATLAVVSWLGFAVHDRRFEWATWESADRS